MNEQVRLTKCCPCCKKTKPIDDFYKMTTGKPKSWCKKCDNAYTCKRHREKPFACQVISARWRERHPDRLKVTQKRDQLKKLYGLSLEEYQEIVDQQKGLCAICSQAIEGRNRHLDHNHKTGTVRGILCENCNRGLGMFKDDPCRLRLAANYLEERND